MSLAPGDERKIGGSDVAAICGVSPYAGPLSVWLRIVHGAQQPDNAHTKRGRRLESVVLDWYAEQTGRLLDRGPDGKGVRWATGVPHLRASLDATSREGQREWDRVVDAKTAGATVAHRYGEEGTDQIPPEQLCQFQFYMGLTGRVQTDVPALVAGDFRLYRVAFDADVYGELRERVERFWVDHVLAKVPPEDAPLPRDLEAVGWAFRRSEGKAVDFTSLPPETQVTLEEYLRSYAEESAASDRRALWEARAKLALGPVPGVRGLPPELGFSSISWGKQSGKTAWKRVAEALAKKTGTEAQLSTLAAENTGEGSRPFTPHRPRKQGT